MMTREERSAAIEGAARGVITSGAWRVRGAGAGVRPDLRLLRKDLLSRRLETVRGGQKEDSQAPRASRVNYRCLSCGAPHAVEARYCVHCRKAGWVFPDGVVKKVLRWMVRADAVRSGWRVGYEDGILFAAAEADDWVAEPDDFFSEGDDASRPQEDVLHRFAKHLRERHLPREPGR